MCEPFPESRAPGPALAACLVLVCLMGAGCEREEAPPPAAPQAPRGPVVQAPDPPGDPYERLRRAIREGEASLAQIEEALTERDPPGLCNTVLQLYLARRQAGVPGLVAALWHGERERAPSANWTALERAPARVAVAHTFARMHPEGAAPALAYIREALAGGDAFTRAQAAAALAFVGSEADVPRLRELARTGPDYAAEAAIKALAIRGGEAAKQALLELREVHAGDPRKRRVIRQVLAERYPEMRRGRMNPAPQDPPAD